jgi:NAD(P)-dependent dehydrogenase (short-subunit alcohol dehydrogenase family)
MDLTNASAIVTGGAGGFGSATVRRLAQKGTEALTVRATRNATSENAEQEKFGEHGFAPVLCARYTTEGTRLPTGIM